MRISDWSSDVCSSDLDGIKVNFTLCFSAAQAILAAKAGAAYISPFVGRLDDTGADGLQLIAEIVEIYNAYPDFHTEVLVASVRYVGHIIEAAKMGADVATIPPAEIGRAACRERVGKYV